MLRGQRAGSDININKDRRRRQEAKAADCKSAIVGSTPTAPFSPPFANGGFFIANSPHGNDLSRAAWLRCVSPLLATISRFSARSPRNFSPLIEQDFYLPTYVVFWQRFTLSNICFRLLTRANGELGFGNAGAGGCDKSCRYAACSTIRFDASLLRKPLIESLTTLPSHR